MELGMRLGLGLKIGQDMRPGMAHVMGKKLVI